MGYLKKREEDMKMGQRCELGEMVAGRRDEREECGHITLYTCVDFSDKCSTQEERTQECTSTGMTWDQERGDPRV